MEQKVLKLYSGNTSMPKIGKIRKDHVNIVVSLPTYFELTELRMHLIAKEERIVPYEDVLTELLKVYYNRKGH